MFLNPPWESPIERDPLLVQLGGQDWRRVQVYSDVDAGPAKSGYSVDDEFPHLAERLLALQDFVRIQAPNSFWGLMADRRDVYRFWMGRITLWLGTGVPVLMTLQLTVAVAQLVVCDFEDRPRGSALHYIGRMLGPFFVGNAFCNIRLSCSSTKLLPNIENTCYA